MTESLKETITRMEAELKDMRARVKEDAAHMFKVGDKVLIEAVVSRDGVDAEGDVAVHVNRANGDTFLTYVGPLEVHPFEEPVTVEEATEELTPCEKAGYKVGDEFIIINADDDDLEEGFGTGTLVQLCYDDRTYMPEFENAIGSTRYLSISSDYNQVQKINK